MKFSCAHTSRHDGILGSRVEGTGILYHGTSGKLSVPRTGRLFCEERKPGRHWLEGSVDGRLCLFYFIYIILNITS